MWRRIHLVVLTAALIFEVLFAAAGFFIPALVLEKFGIEVTSVTLFLAFALAWLLLFVTLVCSWNLILVRKRHAHGFTLSYILGFWWIGVGLALFIKYGRVDNFFIDAVKGAVLVIATARNQKG